MPPLTLTRPQLYDRVWKTPIETLSKEFGLSGRGRQRLHFLAAGARGI